MVNSEDTYLSSQDFELGFRVRISSQGLKLGFRARISSQDFESGSRVRICNQNFKSGLRLTISSPFDFSKNLEMQNCAFPIVEERYMTTQTRLQGQNTSGK